MGSKIYKTLLQKKKNSNKPMESWTYNSTGYLYKNNWWITQE